MTEARWGGEGRANAGCILVSWCDKRKKEKKKNPKQKNQPQNPSRSRGRNKDRLPHSIPVLFPRHSRTGDFPVLTAGPLLRGLRRDAARSASRPRHPPPRAPVADLLPPVRVAEEAAVTPPQGLAQLPLLPHPHLQRQPGVTGGRPRPVPLPPADPTRTCVSCPKPWGQAPSWKGSRG